jgi:hypothetical protein
MGLFGAKTAVVVAAFGVAGTVVGSLDVDELADEIVGVFDVGGVVVGVLEGAVLEGAVLEGTLGAEVFGAEALATFASGVVWIGSTVVASMGRAWEAAVSGSMSIAMMRLVASTRD